MVQTVKSFTLLPGHQKIFIEKPHVLRRIFFRISAILSAVNGYQSRISFGDPTFVDCYILSLANTYFESKGEGIFQGDIWVNNYSSISINYSVTEILV